MKWPLPDIQYRLGGYFYEARPLKDLRPLIPLAKPPKRNYNKHYKNKKEQDEKSNTGLR